MLLALVCTGEDPYLTSVYAREIIRAMQGGFGPGGGNASARYYKTITTPKVSIAANCRTISDVGYLTMELLQTIRRSHPCCAVLCCAVLCGS